MENTLNLLAIEGVQGSGKSTLGVQLSHWDIASYVPLISPIKRPKMFDQKDGGAGLSLMTDIIWFSSAVKTAILEPNPQPTILDRFILSQWVYGTLRGSSGFDYPDILEGMLSSFSEWGTVITTDILRRNFSLKVQRINSINLVYLLLLPSTALVNSRRATSLRKFKYKPEQELKLYYETIPVLEKLGIPCILLDGTEKIKEVSEKIDATFLSLSSR